MSIAIRNIQHFMYCPRRFALLEINRDWKENMFVVSANLMHEKVNNGSHSVHSQNLISMSNIRLYNDELDIYGVADCIEFKRSKNGVFISMLDGYFDVRVIEYKPTRPKNNEISETDAIQVFAQKLCADSLWGCKSEAYIYYSDVRKRTKLPFDEEYERYYSILIEIIDGMNDIYESGNIPSKRKVQKCSGCSMKDICIPLRNGKISLKDEICRLMEA